VTGGAIVIDRGQEDYYQAMTIIVENLDWLQLPVALLWPWWGHYWLIQWWPQLLWWLPGDAGILVTRRCKLLRVWKLLENYWKWCIIVTVPLLMWRLPIDVTHGGPSFIILMIYCVTWYDYYIVLNSVVYYWWGGIVVDDPMEGGLVILVPLLTLMYSWVWYYYCDIDYDMKPQCHYVIMKDET